MSDEYFGSNDLAEISYTYDDGSVRMLKGADAKQWQEWIDALCVLAENRNSNYPFAQLNWIVIKNNRERHI